MNTDRDVERVADFIAFQRAGGVAPLDTIFAVELEYPGLSLTVFCRALKKFLATVVAHDAGGRIQ